VAAIFSSAGGIYQGSISVPRVLVVDDEESICWGLSRLGESLGHEVVAASSAEQGLARVESSRPDVVILDVRLPGMDGLAAIKRFQELCGTVPIIVITAHGDLQTAVEAVRRGAFDYIAKPFDLGKVKGALVRALASRPGGISENPARGLRVEGMVGRSPAMQDVYKLIALAAASDASVLLCGESGTGKELAARAIHRYSSRSAGPLVAVNVAALSSSLAESELFGHVGGTFAGAEAARTGLLAQAHGGTLFLDEVADIPPPTQVKLLRALEHGEFTPVGGTEPVVSDFRVISATHRNLARCVEEGSFRHDLYFRLSAFQIDLPALRDRRQDIAELAEHFTTLLAKPPGTPKVAITPEALAELEQRAWRGNVRELRNAIDHALVMARGRAIMPEHLPQPSATAIAANSGDHSDADVAAAVRQWAEQNVGDPQWAGRLYERLIAVVEPPLLTAAMNQHKGQCAAAARQLGIHRTTLRKKLTDHGLDDNASD
jgi:two-component system nitrogen regulation response regulator GlnG